MEPNQTQNNTQADSAPIETNENVLNKPIENFVGKRILNILGVFMLIVSIICFLVLGFLWLVMSGFTNSSPDLLVTEFFLFVIPSIIFIFLTIFGLKLNQKNKGSQLLILLSVLFYGLLIFLGLNYWAFGGVL